MIEMYTDGACKGNPGPGGWAALIIYSDGKRTPLSGGPVPNTTNQRMEVQAAIEGLSAIGGLSKVGAKADVRLYSDSLYLVNTMTKGWKRRANQDLWARLDRLVADLNVDFRWVKGHNGHPLQEEADRLASEAASPVISGGAPGASDPHGPALSHVDAHGDARMVDVTAKPDTERVATAKGRVVMAPETLALIRSGTAAKGDVLAVARVAGIMGAKRTSDLIPLCHPLMLTDVAVEFAFDESEPAVDITATAKLIGKTGVEMEALTAVTIAALTIYDMCKAVDRRMRIEAVRLVRKSGGKSGEIVLE